MLRTSARSDRRLPFALTSCWRKSEGLFKERKSRAQEGSRARPAYNNSQRLAQA